jgi:hypothetical protein
VISAVGFFYIPGIRLRAGTQGMPQKMALRNYFAEEIRLWTNTPSA